MRKPDLGQDYRKRLFQECADSGDAFTTIMLAKEQEIDDPVLTLLEPACDFGGGILQVLVRGGICTQAEVDDVLHACEEEGRTPCVAFALTWHMLRHMLVGTDNLHMVERLDAVIDGGRLRPAIIAAGNSITATAYDPDTITKPKPAELERARRRQRSRRQGR